MVWSSGWRKHFYVVVRRAERKRVRSLCRRDVAAANRDQRNHRRPIGELWATRRAFLEERVAFLESKIPDTRAQLPASVRGQACNMPAKMSAARSIAPPDRASLALRPGSPFISVAGARCIPAGVEPRCDCFGSEIVLHQFRDHAPSRNQIHHREKWRADHPAENEAVSGATR